MIFRCFSRFSSGNLIKKFQKFAIFRVFHNFPKSAPIKKCIGFGLKTEHRCTISKSNFLHFFALFLQKPGFSGPEKHPIFTKNSHFFALKNFVKIGVFHLFLDVQKSPIFHRFSVQKIVLKFHQFLTTFLALQC